MCGIAGYVLRRPTADPSTALRLLEGIRARGPDDEGICVITRGERQIRHLRTHRTVAYTEFPPAEGAQPAPHDAALVCSRFAIIDRSPRGHQPFASGDGMVIAVCNGEIYNYVELRDELTAAGVTFRTASDTEVLVEGYRAWGDAAWSRINGFWAVALFDSRTGSLVLSRDRLGVAPLYYREDTGGLHFASNIRSLAAIPPHPALDQAYAAGWVETGIKDFDRSTCFSGVRSFEPGAFATIPVDEYRITGAARPFWQPPSRRLTAAELPFSNAVDRVRDTLFSAVTLRLRADVPIAFELSGGLDSSSLVAAAHTTGQRDIRTYTIRVAGQDEEPYARVMLERYALDYRVIDQAEEPFFDELAHFADLMEEPYHSPNIYTHYRMRRRMKADGVDVAVSGSGGDEVLAGYEFDFWPAAARDISSSGRPLAALAFSLASRFGTWDRTLDTLKTRTRWLTTGIRRHWKRPLAFYRERFAAPPLLPATSDEGTERTAAARLLSHYRDLSFSEQMLFHLRVAQLPYYLRSNDHFTMSIPVEHRFPFLDYRMVELGLQLPTTYLFRNGWTKYVLRKAMEPFLPAAITWRREKMGFPFPLHGFLASHRERLIPFCGYDVTRYDALRAEDPDKLWRACSLGMWRRSLDVTHPIRTIASVSSRDVRSSRGES